MLNHKTIVNLRPVTASDLPLFFEQQREPAAVQMAAFPSREREAFMEHWHRILRNDSLFKQTIVWNGQVAGNVVCFERDGKWEVGYWLGQAYWSHGIATQALTAFLAQIPQRPLYAHVAQHNPASRRVLEKCGFVLSGEDPEFAVIAGQVVKGFVLQLDQAPL